MKLHMVWIQANGKRFVNMTIPKGWVNIDGQNYYFDETTGILQ